VVQTARVTWTYREYRLLPDDGRRYEVLDGDLYVNPAPTTTHQTVSKRLQLELMLQLERTGRGVVFNAPVDAIFSDTSVAQPDLLVVAASRRNIISERGIEGPPDLIVEILSPRTERADREIKFKLYASAGVREYWIIDIRARRIEVFSLGPTGYGEARTFGPSSNVSSGIFEFSMPVDTLFE
jgi:Uma2 family endonuclease